MLANSAELVEELPEGHAHRHGGGWDLAGREVVTSTDQNKKGGRRRFPTTPAFKPLLLVLLN